MNAGKEENHPLPAFFLQECPGKGKGIPRYARKDVALIGLWGEEGAGGGFAAPCPLLKIANYLSFRAKRGIPKSILLFLSDSTDCSHQIL